MSKLLLLCLAIFGLTSADHPAWHRDFEPIPITDNTTRSIEQVYRLPETVKPLEYDIYLDLYFAERTDRPFSYDGRETIIIEVCDSFLTIL